MRTWLSMCSIDIKVLKDLEENPSLARSAGACPPRSSDPREKRTPAKAVFPIEARRGTGPRPTVNGTLFFTVARGTGPRDTVHEKKRGRQPSRPPPARDMKQQHELLPLLDFTDSTNYSRCLTSPNVVNERFAGETGPGNRRVRNTSGRPPNETSSIW